MPVFEFCKHLYLDQVDIYTHSFIFFFLFYGSHSDLCMPFLSPLTTDNK